jgi:hypothetical protein
MGNSSRYRHIEFGGPATYRIVVQGTLAEDWSDRLAGMTIRSANSDDEGTQTTLTGLIRDQAELNGVLDTLYGLHLSIIKVEQMAEED